MKNKANPAPVAPPAMAPLEIVAVVPPAFEAYDKNLKPMALQMAIQIGSKNPDIVKAALDFREAYGRAGEKFFAVASSLRSAKLVGKEATLLMLGLGFSKSRTSEMIRLSSVSDAIWNQYSAQKVGFRVALALDKPKDTPRETSSSTGGTEGEEGQNNSSTPAQVKLHDLPEKAKAPFLAALKAWSRPLKDGTKTEYTLQAEIDGVKFYVAITASPK